jgi:hypothetical protein
MSQYIISWAQDQNTITCHIKCDESFKAIKLVVGCHNRKLTLHDKTYKERTLQHSGKSNFWNSTNLQNRQILIAQNLHCDLFPHLFAEGSNTLQVAAHAWYTLYNERNAYYCRKQVQLLAEMEAYNLPPVLMIQVIKEFSDYFQPTATCRQQGSSRALRRILQHRMPAQFKDEALKLVDLLDVYAADFGRFCLWCSLEVTIQSIDKAIANGKQ